MVCTRDKNSKKFQRGEPLFGFVAFRGSKSFRINRSPSGFYLFWTAVEKKAESATVAEDEPYKSEQAQLDFREKRWFYRVRVGFLLTATLATLGIVLTYILNIALPEKYRCICSIIRGK